MSPAISICCAARPFLRKPFRRENLRHFENVTVIIALRQRIRCILVEDKGYVGMHLQSGSADGGGDGAFNGFGNSSGFGTARGKKKNTTRIENSANAHGDGALWHFRFVGEKVAIVLNRFAAKCFP